MSRLKLKNISKRYPNGFVAVKDLNLNIEDKEFIIFVGPSGSGKSTALRMIAGLEEISSGELYIEDQFMNGILPKDRDIAMVFQNYALYPHMTVYDNMAFGLKMKKIKKDEINKRVYNAAKILDIESLLYKRPDVLSGGEKQRVAMGRAIVREPKIFLMDEPLSNLDAKLRVQMRTEIHNLYQKLKSTFVYVTHDQTEAMTLGTKVVVLKDGVIQQIDSPKNLYNKPKNLFVAGFIGSPQMNFINGKIIKNRDDILAVFGNNNIKLPLDKSKKIVDNGYIDKDVIFGIRAEDIYKNKNIYNNTINAEVKNTELLGSETNIYMDIQGQSAVSYVSSKENIKAGDKLKISFDPEKIHIFDKSTENAVIN